MRAIDDTRASALCGAYLQARYRVALPGGEVRLAIGAPAPAALRRALAGANAAQAPAFGVITAFNPGSTACDDATNRAADAALRKALHDIRLRGPAGTTLLRTHAGAADGGWPEDGWLVPGLDTADLDRLARRFGQIGTLHAAAGAPVRLRLALPRPAGRPTHPHVDWRPG